MPPIFLITDSNVAPLAAPFLEACRQVAPTRQIIIPAGEANKNLTTLASICEALSTGGATRQSIIVNVGGGMVTDMGGFAAAIFKRGIRYINVATTLLAAVDAAIGGKTAIDFVAGSSLLKNELGAFHLPLATIPAPSLFGSLPPMEFLSGLGEVIKTAMLGSEEIYNYLLANPTIEADSPRMAEITQFCADYKKDITTQDPTEQGIRRSLNLGHTAGHSFESLLISQGIPLPHGICIAHGLLFTLILSHLTAKDSDESMGATPSSPGNAIKSNEIHRYRNYLREAFPALPLKCSHIPELISLMAHDKKNLSAGSPRFVLLHGIGHGAYDFTPSKEQIEEAFEIFFTI